MGVNYDVKEIVEIMAGELKWSKSKQQVKIRQLIKKLKFFVN